MLVLPQNNSRNQCYYKTCIKKEMVLFMEKQNTKYKKKQNKTKHSRTAVDGNK